MTKFLFLNYLGKTILPLLLLPLFIIFNPIAKGTAAESYAAYENLTIKTDSFDLGLVLSGGGALGLAHLGVLQYLEENGIAPDQIAGTSMGGIMGAMYAAGYSAVEIEKWVKKQDWDYLLSNRFNRKLANLESREKQDKFLISVKPNPDHSGVSPGGSLINGINIYLLMQEMLLPKLGNPSFEALQIPFFCVAADLISEKEVVLDSGLIPEALLATMAIPGLFNPVKRDSQVLVDGGLLNNFPVKEMRRRGAKKVIGVRFDTSEEEVNPDYLFSVLSRTYEVLMSYVRKQFEGEPDLLIQVPLKDFSLLDFSQPDSIIRRGYRAAEEKGEEIKALFQQKITPSSNTVKLSTVVDSAFHLSSIQVKGNERISSNRILFNLHLNTENTYVYGDIIDAIRRIQASDQLDRVLFRLSDNNEKKGKDLIIQVQEKSNALLNIGLRYDSDFGPSILLNPQLKDAVANGSLFDISLRLNSNPYLSLDYKLNARGNFIPYLQVYTGGEDFFSFSNGEDVAIEQLNKFEGLFGLQWNPGVASRVKAGVGGQLYGFTRKYRQFIFEDINKNLYFAFFKLESETLDDGIFPTRGHHLQANSQWLSEPPLLLNTANLNTIITIDFQQYIPLSEKLSWFTGLQWGYSSKKADRPFQFFTGGLDNHFRSNLFFQAGLPLMRYQGAQAIGLRGHLQLISQKNHKIWGGISVSALSDEVKDFFDTSFFQGIYAGYGFRSSQGPIEIILSSPTHKLHVEVLVRAGYKF